MRCTLYRNAHGEAGTNISLRTAGGEAMGLQCRIRTESEPGAVFGETGERVATKYLRT